jgi:hypothetical protein
MEMAPDRNEGLSLRRWHGGPRPQQNLLAHDGGAALADRIAAPLGERREPFQAAGKNSESRLRDHPLAYLARARDRAGDDRHAGPRERGEVGDDRVVGAVFEQAPSDEAATMASLAARPAKRRPSGTVSFQS